MAWLDTVRALEWSPHAGWAPPLALAALACLAWRPRVQTTTAVRTARTFACLLLALTLSNPTLPRASEGAPDEAAPAHVRVLLDRSGSMHATHTPRLIDLAEAWTKTWIEDARLAGGSDPVIRVDVQPFAATLGRAAPTLSADTEALDKSATDLARALAGNLDALAQDPHARDIVLWTDARDTTGVPIEPLAERAQALGIRLHTPNLARLGLIVDDTAGTTGTTNARDDAARPVRLAVSVTPDTVAPSEPVRARAVVLTRTDHARALDLELVALVPGVGPLGVWRETPLAGARLPRADDGAAWSRREHEWTVHPPPGTRAMLVRARADLGDPAEARAPLRVLDQRAEILLVENEPSWDVTFARRAWQRDPRLRVTRLLLVDPALGVARLVTDRAPPEPAEHLTGARLARFHVIAFAPGVRAALERDLARPSGANAWVADLLDAAGWSPASIEFHASRTDNAGHTGGAGAHELRLTPFGRAVLGDLPPVHSLAPPARSLNDPASIALAHTIDPRTREATPAITLRDRRERRVIEIGSPGLWRAWRSSGDAPWRRLARLAAFGDADHGDPDDPDHPEELGTAPPATDTTAPADSPELLEPEPRHDTLRALAFITGGIHFDPVGDGADVRRDITARARSRSIEDQRRALIDPRLSITLAACTLLIAWRRREGGSL